ncbi:MAG TPA: DUF4350 domain-containing protein [Polyangiaceae bacterium]
MKRAVLAFVALTCVAGSARAALDPAKAQATVEEARKDGFDAFCTAPPRPLPARARSLCPLAGDIQGCGALASACEDDPIPKPHEPQTGFSRVLAQIVNGLVWLLVAGAVGVAIVFIVRAILRARRDDQAADPDEKDRPAQVTPLAAAAALETVSDAELLLRRAEEQASRGDLNAAAALYLAAALRALDRLGAIRIARHRTNGEYVRACQDPTAKPELRAIVREVDRAQFGHEPLTVEGIRAVAARASAIVARTAASAMVLLAILSGTSACAPGGPPLKGSDPAGDDLFIEVLRRQGANVGRVTRSLATLPIPKGDEEEPQPLVVVDAERTPLDEETRAHLARWVEAGGRLLLAGDVGSWGETFHARPAMVSGTDVVLHPESIPVDADEDDEEDLEDRALEAAKGYPARVAQGAGIEWRKAVRIGAIDTATEYAGALVLGRGLMVGLAGNELLTNAGLARAPNAAAMVALVQRCAAGRKIEVARPENGISPPSNPLSSLLHAGLGLALEHAGAATLLLILAFGIRQARPRLAPPPARRAWTEHIEATGGLYARGRLAAHALAMYARFVDGRLRPRMPRGQSDAAAFLALRSGADPAYCATVWARASAARSTDRARGDELTTLRALSALYAAASKNE